MTSAKTPDIFGANLGGRLKPLDRLTLNNMRFFGYHGLYPEEKKLGQRFEIDLEVRGDFAAGAAVDDPSLFVDYAQLYETVREVLTGESCDLVETLAERVAGAIGSNFAPIKVTVRVRKPHPPIDADFDGVEVEIQRSYG